MSELQGKVAIVTGAARGIGREYCLGLARAGARIVAADLRSCEDTLAAVRAQGGEGVGVEVDVARRDSTQAMAEAAMRAYGRIDVLVNNAALYGDLAGFTALTDLDEDEWDRVMAINVKGVWQATRAVVPYMAAQRYGKIVNIASATILMGVPGVLHYVTSKGAVWAMSRSMARELGPQGIRINCITPGFTMSQASRDLMEKSGAAGMEQMIVAQCALGREQQPQDLVGTVVFLASPGSDFITGQTVNVDGGVVHW
jgi:NAD(P)-dependent dehydrogenase (short-subunit alcohol dehydrogenase family)